MGNQPNFKQYEQLMAQYEQIQECSNQGLRYLEHKVTHQDYLLREISCHDQESFKETEGKFRMKKEQLSNKRHVSGLVEVISNQQDQYCMTFYKIYALFEFPQRTLDDQINERALQKRKFQEKELWSILASCILGMSHLQKNSIRHSCLKSSSILLTPEGIIKVYDPIATGSRSNYDTILNQRTTPHIYLSPEQCQQLREERQSDEADPFKSDIWTMGMIVIEAGLLHYQDECYREQGGRIYWQTLQYNISLFQQTYSPQLTNLVQFMIGKDQRARPDWFELEQYVIKVEQDGQDTQPPVHSGLESRRGASLLDCPSYRSSDMPMLPSSEPPTSSNDRLFSPPSLASPPVHLSSASAVDGAVRPSDISISRPMRNLFPVNTYTQKSSIDQNLVQIEEEEHPVTQWQPPSIPEPPRYHTYSTGFASPSYAPPPPINPASSVPYSIPAAPTAASPTLSQSVREQGQFVMEHYKQGSRYQGYKLNGQKHGFGKFYYQDGGLYQGQWKHNKMEGYGKLYYQSDRLAYEGEWFNDQFSGRGTLYNEYPQTLQSSFNYRNFDDIEEYWTKYEGDFQEDMKHGFGKLHLSNGEYFEGHFHNDYADGQGVFIRASKQKVSGIWRNNILE